MYEKFNEAQRIGLIYGAKLRVAGSIEGNIGYAERFEFQVFTREELQAIQAITQTAKDRAKKEYYDAKAKLPPKGNGK